MRDVVTLTHLLMYSGEEYERCCNVDTSVDVFR